jgi:hypothetical protein
VCEIFGLNPKSAHKTAGLEGGRGEWNFRCSGEMRRYRKEHLWRKRLTGPFLTLKLES